MILEKKETGEIYEYDDVYFIDEERIKEEEKFDGYYAASPPVIGE